MKTTERKPDRLFQTILEDTARGGEHLAAGVKHLADARRCYYRAAEAYGVAFDQHREWLLDQIRGETARGDVDAWVDRHFGPMENYLRERPMKLVQAIREGLTLEEYLERPARVFLSQKRRAANLDNLAERAGAVAATPPPPETLDPERRARLLKAQVRESRLIVRELRKELVCLRTEIGRLRTENHDLRIKLGRIEKVLGEKATA